MALSRKSFEGEISVDHTASPGFTPEQARKLGYLPYTVAEGKLFEAPTMGCNHCGTVVIMNPDRHREREYCMQCNMYVCDNCGLERKTSGYTHRTYRQKLDEIISANQRIQI